MDKQEADEPYKPPYKADVEPRVSTNPQQRPRKFLDGKKLRMKNAQGIFQYDVTVVSAKYDEAKHKWMYTLKDFKMEPIAEPVAETELG